MITRKQVNSLKIGDVLHREVIDDFFGVLMVIEVNKKIIKCSSTGICGGVWFYKSRLIGVSFIIG
jgi:hypothetical protein